MDYVEFSRLVHALGEYVQVLVADHQGVAQSAAVIPYSAHCAYYMHGGTIAKPVSGASNLLQWEAIRLFRNLGVGRYNFYGVRMAPAKGSKAEGIRMFKERFGGAVVPVFMWKVPLARGKYMLYKLAAALRNGGDVVDQELRRGRTLQRRPDGISSSDCSQGPACRERGK
jgi:lipid II:glycine glycyltransferase (peptidoglycan interpeptide bridge formation enzyme)